LYKVLFVSFYFKYRYIKQIKENDIFSLLFIIAYMAIINSPEEKTEICTFVHKKCAASGSEGGRYRYFFDES
jgi:hypothetical protein